MQCDRSEPWEHGTVVLTPSCPDFWDANAVRVEGAPEVDGPALHAAAERLMAGWPHRKIDVEDEALGARCEPYFEQLGWMHERLAMMRRSGSPPVVDASHPVEEVPLAESRGLRAEWFSVWQGDRAEKERFSAAQEPILARRGMRAFVVRDRGVLMLAMGEDAVEVDGLYVTPKARGRGIASALMAAALEAGGRDVAWIVADDAGLARPLYERLGFTAVWHPYCFIRVPS